MATLQIIKSVNEYFRFILDGDPLQTVIDNAPNATSFGSIFHFKTKNGAVLFGQQNILYSDITYTDISSVDFTFASVDAVWIKLISEGFFDGLGAGGGGGGVTRFDNLDDTFSYIGNDGKVPVVDSSQLKLVPTTFYNFNEFTQLEDVEISSLIVGKIIGVELVLGVPKVVLRDPPADPVQLANAVGFMDYNDLGTHTTALTLVANVDKKLTNDTLGAFTNVANRPFGVGLIWDEINNSYDFSELTVGDTLDIRFDISVTTTSANQRVKAFLRLAEGTPSQYDIPFLDAQYKTAGTYQIIRYLGIYISSDVFRLNPASYYVNTDSSGSCVVNGWYNRILRKEVNILTIEGVSEAPIDGAIYGRKDGLWVPNNGDITTTVIPILSSDLDSQDVAGMVTYINALNPNVVVAANEILRFQVTDTGQLFGFNLHGVTVGYGQPAIVASDILEIEIGQQLKTERGWTPLGHSSTVITANGVPALTLVGTAQSNPVDSGVLYNKRMITSARSSAVAGNSAGWTNQGTYFAFLEPSLEWKHEFYFGDSSPINITDKRLFVGFKFTIGGIGNVNPSTISRIYGIGADGADTNLQIYYSEGLGVPLKIDLGSNFNKNNVTDFFYFSLKKIKNERNIEYYVKNLNTGLVTSGIFSYLSAADTFYGLEQIHINNNTTAAEARISISEIKRTVYHV